jgi:hypothetical protein
MQKKISLLMIVSYLGSMSAMAAAPTTKTPERVMLENIMALQGQKLSADEVQARSADAVSKYLAVASADAGQQARLEQAFVDLGIYTPAQAQSYVADAQKAAGNATSKDSMAAEIAQLAAQHPAGAQFSLSDYDINICTVSAAVAVAGLAGLLWGADKYNENPSCSTPSENGTAYDPANGQVLEVTIATGPTTCTKANYYPYNHAATNGMVIGGVVAVAAGVLAWEACNSDWGWN